MNRVITHVLVTWPAVRAEHGDIPQVTKLFGFVEYLEQGLHWMEDTVVRWLTAEEAIKWGREVRQ